MGTWIRGLGWWDEDKEYGSLTKRAILPMTNGGAMAVIPDGNTTEAFAKANPNFVPDPGDGTTVDKIWIFELNSAFTTINQVAAITSGNLDRPYDVITADLYSDNSVGIVYLRNNGNLCYRKVTYGSWTIGGEQVIMAAGSNYIDRVDLSITETDVPVVQVMVRSDASPKVVMRTYVRRTSDSSWFLGSSVTIVSTGTVRLPYIDGSVAVLKGGTNTTRNVILAACASQGGNNDLGAMIYSAKLNESTGSLTSVTKRKTYLAGDLGQTTEGWMPRRVYLFASGPSEVTIAYMQTSGPKRMLVARATFDGTWTETIQAHTYKSGFKYISQKSRCTISYANDTVIFYMHHEFGRDAADRVINYVAKIDDANKTVKWANGHFKWDGLSDSSVPAVFTQAGTGRNADITTKHYTLHFEQYAGGAWHAEAHRIDAPLAPVGVTPSDGSSLITSTPNLAVKARLGKKWPQCEHKVVWQFATDSGFTTNVKTYTQPDSKFVEIIGTETTKDVKGNDVDKWMLITDVLPSSYMLTQATWYLRARLQDNVGTVSSWSSTQTLTITHPPSAMNLRPTGGQRIAYGTGDVSFRWQFSDPSSTDAQTAYEIVVERDDLGTVVASTGKQSSSDNTAIVNINSAYQDVLLRWKVQVWDSDDIPGGYSNEAFFELSSSPTVAIDSVGSGGALDSSLPQVTFTSTVGNNRRIRHYQAIFTQGDTTVHDSGKIGVDVTSGTQINYKSITPALSNNEFYSVQVTVWDDMQMVGKSALTSFSTAWTPPAQPTGVWADHSNYDTEGEGYVALYWDDTNRDTDYTGWVVYRRDDTLDSDFQVIETGEWNEVGRVYDVVTTTQYKFKDFTAPSGYKCNYKVTQLVDRFGNVVQSDDSSVVVAYPESEGYWLLNPDTEEAYLLHNVTQDEYSDDYDEYETNIIGKGRHVDRGDRLGRKGQLVAQIRKDARQRKIELERIKDENLSLYMRNPFGDVWLVYVGNLAISRIAGVGRSEFVDVTIPYSEVS